MHLLALLTDSPVRLSSRLRTIGRYGFCNMPSITPYLATPSDSPQTVSVPEQWGVTHMWHVACLVHFLSLLLPCLPCFPLRTKNSPAPELALRLRACFSIYPNSSLLLPLSKNTRNESV